LQISPSQGPDGGSLAAAVERAMAAAARAAARTTDCRNGRACRA